MTRKTIGVMLAFVLFSLAGCSATIDFESFLRQEVTLDYVKKVAVLPFANNSTDPLASLRCREIIMTEVMASGRFEVVEKGQVDSLLKAEAIDPGAPIDAPLLRRLAQRLGVQAFLMGSVDDVGVNQIGNAAYPVFSMSMRLVDSESDLVLWQASGRKTGYSIWGRLFGIGYKDSFQVTLELIRTLLATMGEPTSTKA
jgi:TolB-like protein